MDRALQTALLEELLGLKDNGLFFLDDEVAFSPVERYASAGRFDAEMKNLFRAEPVIAAHISEMADAGSYITRSLHGLPILLTRDKSGEVHAFLNVCRHRGAKLVLEETGCKHIFSCPYHAWSWNNEGELRGIPHEKPGFPGIDRTSYGLKRLPCVERYGFVWVVADIKAQPDFDTFLAPLADDFDWLETEELGIAESTTLDLAANWKLLLEGGIEAYHFKVAHRDTIGPHFLDNLSSYEMLGVHMRSVLPRSNLEVLKDMPKDQWSIRDYTNILYTAFPTNQFLVMQDHVAWVELQPKAHDRTILRLSTLAPRAELTSEKASHWMQNHQITSVTLGEDFAINEAVQSGFESGVNTTLTFGRYEGALDSINLEVERAIERNR